MNKFKTFLLSSLAIAGLLALPACKTSTQVTTDANGNSVTNTIKTPDTARIAAVANEAASVGTTEVLQSHPEWAPQFQLAAEQLSVLAASPSISVQDILNIAQELPVKELKSQTARLSFEGATILIAALDVPELPADKLAVLQPIAKAISDGIMRGIQNAPTTPPAKPAATTAPAPASPPASS